MAAADLSIHEVIALAEETSKIAKGLQVRSSASAAPLPEIPEALSKQVAQDEARLDQVMTQPDPVDAAQAQALIETAEALHQVRTKYQGDQWWETIDARQRLANLREWVTFIPTQRSEFGEAVELSRQVEALARNGKYKEALAAATNCLDINRRIWGAGHPYEAMSLSHLAVLFIELGRYSEAVPLFEGALAIYRRTVGEKHPATAAVLGGLAMVYSGQGVYGEARPLYEQALVIREQVLGPTHPSTAKSLNNLAELYREQGAYEEARPLYERALAINEQVLGATHPSTAKSLNNLAHLYQDTLVQNSV